MTTSLSDVMTPEEYDALVALTEKADRLVMDRYRDFNKAVQPVYNKMGFRGLRGIRYKSRDADRPGRDPDGRYDIVVYYDDPYEDSDGSFYLPSSILWDPAAAIGKTIEAIEAERAEHARVEAEAEAETAKRAEADEALLAARLAKKHGYVKKEASR